MKKSNFWLGLSAVGLSLSVLAAAGSTLAFGPYENLINDALGLNVKKISKSFRSDYADENGNLSDDGWKRMIKDAYQFAVEEEEQGSVLLKNDKNVLPLKENEHKVTVFGHNAAHLFHRSGAGGAAPNDAYVVRLNEGFEKAGLEINPTVWNLYSPTKTFSPESVKVSSNDDPEDPVTIYTDEVKDSFGDYNGAAIVVFRRCGTEDSDPSLNFKNSQADVGALDLKPNEADLLKMIKESEAFSKTIVLINSPMPMSLDYASQEEYGVDAVLYFGVPGYYSMEGVGNVIVGKANPSGHTCVTFPTHCSNSAAVQNFGNPGFKGDNASGNYVIYQEGIYVGYKYYETRYADCVLGRGNANGDAGTYNGETSWAYDEEVAYPFGYGLSYVDFKQKMTSLTYNAETDEIEAEIEVENLGDREGRDAAQLFFQSPYTEGGLPKAAIQLLGYEKVELRAHEKKTVKVTAPRYFMASYDPNEDNGDGTKGGYILEDGKYYFSCGNGVHEALNNILGKTVPNAELKDHDGIKYTADLDCVKELDISGAINAYKKSIYNKDVQVNNQFEDADVNYWADSSEKITYLSRDNWQGTWPTGSDHNITQSQTMKDAMNMNKIYQKPADAKSYKDGDGIDYNVKLDNPIKFSDVATWEYDDPRWNDFIKQMSLNDLTISMSDNRGILAVPSVGKPTNSIAEGPEGLLMPYAYGDGRWATGFATGPVYTSTWDHAMQAKFGAFYGEDALYCGVSGVNAPGANICRTAYTSRASEYMSEDGVMNYLTASNIIKAARQKGLIMNIKHCFLNNQEKNRQKIATFSNEQAIREIYLRPFEGALTKGEGLGIMTSYNRIGLRYAAAHDKLAFNVMRSEWNYKGLIIDDALAARTNTDDYSNTAAMILGGTEVFCLDGGRGSLIRDLITSTDDGYLLSLCQKANKDIMYAYAQSWMGDAGRAAAEAAAKGDQVEEIEVQERFKWWIPVVWSIDGVFGAFTIASIACFVLFAFFKKSEPKEVEETTDGGNA
ncbi:MAG: glycoside hydrolase family 3 C-terminal domain-containing protein [Bacilli bacterium]|nr:glycoside hydrolase family 3 C-terminal domain-containing protein [Bacilli bacterium]